MEYWDLYDKNMKKLNKTARRGDKLLDSEFHLVVNAWIKNQKGEFLITQRSANKSHPLMWECTGGSALAGEDSLMAAFREVKEELGIDISKWQYKFIGRTLRYYEHCNDILEVYLFYSDEDIKNVKVQEEEVNDVMWASKDKILDLYNNGKFEANAYFKEVVEEKFCNAK